MPDLVHFHDDVDRRIQDTALKLDYASRDSLIRQAILQRYSKDRPTEKVSDVMGTGDGFLPAPTGFEDGFSFVKQVEYPIGQIPPLILESDDWLLYRSPSGLKIMLNSLKPSDNARVTWTARQADDGTTVPDADYQAVVDYAAAMCCEALAAVYAQSGDASLNADSVNYRTKGQEYLAVATRLRARYFSHIGIQENADGTGVGPAISMGNVEETMGWGGDRLTHRRPR